MLGRQPSATTRSCAGRALHGAAHMQCAGARRGLRLADEMTVGNVTEVVLPDVSIDDHVFGWRRSGPAGTKASSRRT